MKNEIYDEFAEIKMRKRANLRSKMLKEDTTRKRFWRFVKDQAKSSGNIGALATNGKMVFGQEEIGEAILDHFEKIFEGKRVPVFDKVEDPSQREDILQDIDDILSSMPSNTPVDKYDDQICSPYTIGELRRILHDLKNEKASGIDSIPNELLKHSSPMFRQYILTFLNRILKDGAVPEAMNEGKCVLILSQPSFNPNPNLN